MRRVGGKEWKEAAKRGRAYTLRTIASLYVVLYSENSALLPW